MKSQMILGGSASCFDLYNLERQLEEIHKAPIDFIHFDVVDGRFNRCFILGLPLLETLRPHTHLPIEVHLAVYDPERYVEQFVRAGADIVSIHPEGTDHPEECFDLIKSLGARPALALRAETEPTEALLGLLAESEYVVKLMVNPGFSGQQIQGAAFDKMRRLRGMMDAHGVDNRDRRGRQRPRRDHPRARPERRGDAHRRHQRSVFEAQSVAESARGHAGRAARFRALTATIREIIAVNERTLQRDFVIPKEQKRGPRSRAPLCRVSRLNYHAFRMGPLKIKSAHRL